MRAPTLAFAIAAVFVQTLGPVTPARAADPVTVAFGSTGAEQTWIVPPDVTSVHVILVGGKGGGSGQVVVRPGFGALVEGDLTVVPGQTLYVDVGGSGGAIAGGTGGSGGFNGGGAGGSGSHGAGGGGGATDVRMLPRTDPSSLASRILIAAGGGGEGSDGPTSGGDAGQAGSSDVAGGGGAGTSTAGGAGGASPPGFVGQPGTSGTGGTGGGTGHAGGGGGGGLYGGGGGGATGSVGSGGGGGGGGGSSSTGSATNASVSIDTTGTPVISISYSSDGAGGGSGSGTVHAVVTMASSAVCLELSTTSIDFGTQGFGQVGATASPFDVTNCSGMEEAVMARGTDADGPGSAAWSLVDTGTCADGSLGTDAYRLTLGFPAAPGAAIPLSTQNAPSIVSIEPGDTLEEEVLLDTPCPGSTGAGEVMAMQVIFTAVEALP